MSRGAVGGWGRMRMRGEAAGVGWARGPAPLAGHPAPHPEAGVGRAERL